MALYDIKSELYLSCNQEYSTLTTDDESNQEDSETLDSQVLLISKEKRKELKKRRKIDAEQKWFNSTSTVRIERLNVGSVVTDGSTSEDIDYNPVPNLKDHVSSDSAVRRLHEFVHSQCLVIRDVPEDGNSMYHAVADQMRLLVKKWEGDHTTIRRQVLQYLKENNTPEMTDQHVNTFTESNNWKEYLQQLSEDDIHADHLVLRVLAEMLERQVKIHTYHGTAIAIGETSIKESISLGLLPDRHYVSLWSPDIIPEGRKVKRNPVESNHGHQSSSSSSEENLKSSNCFSQDNSNAIAVVDDCVKALGWVEIKEKLGKYNHQMTYDKMYDKLNGILNKSNDPKVLITHINLMLDRHGSQVNDYTLMYAIQGYRAAAWLTGDHKTSLKKTVALAKNLHQYHTKYPNIISAAITYRLFQFYMDKAMHGKAYRCGQQALMNIRTEAPCSWTSQAYYMNAMMCDILAQLRPKYNQKYRNEAIQCYEMAKEHWLYQNCQEDSNYLYYPILYTLYTVYIILDMPALPCMYTFRNIHITLQRGAKCDVNMSDVAKAEKILCTVTPKQIDILEEDYRLVIYERITIAKAFINLRCSQLYGQSHDYGKALDALQQGRNNFKLWENEHNDVTNSWYNMSPFVSTDLNTLFQNIEDEITFKLPKQGVIVHSMSGHATLSSLSDVKTEAGEFSDQIASNAETLSSGVD